MIKLPGEIYKQPITIGDINTFLLKTDWSNSQWTDVTWKSYNNHDLKLFYTENVQASDPSDTSALILYVHRPQ
jgi:hypothetical protein